VLSVGLFSTGETQCDMSTTWVDKLQEWDRGKQLPGLPNTFKTSFLWETAPVVRDAPGWGEFEVEYVPSPFLDRVDEDGSPFAEFLDNCDPESQPVVTVPNLSRQSLLVIPCPLEGKEYKSIRQFMEQAPPHQQKALWSAVAKATRAMLKRHDVVWVSTSGLGVYYVHVRIDPAPKYYQTARFKKRP